MSDTAQFGGVVIPESLAQQNFYGLRLDPANGRLTVDTIANGNGVVKLPDDSVLNPLDYRQWLWSTANLSFQFSSNGHLQLEMS